MYGFMDSFSVIDFENWHRKDLYLQYTQRWTTCSFTFNAEVDVTEVVSALNIMQKKKAPAMLYAVTRALNDQENFRMQMVEGKLGSWNVIHPMYPVLNRNKDITFHMTHYQVHFSAFYEEYLQEQKRNAGCELAMAQQMPQNVYSISILPDLSFTGCAFDLKNPKDYLSPVVFLGRFTEKEERLIMPVSITCNHAAADGYHVSLFFKKLQELLNDYKEWMGDMR